MRLFLVGLTLWAGCGFGDNALLRTTRSICGDGIVVAPEACDDGNTLTGDGCSASCSVEATHPICGNGVRENAEACDDGNPSSGDGCSSTCELEARCGDGIVQADRGEDCDDGNAIAGDGCSPSCAIETSASCTLLPQSGCGGPAPACDLTDADTTACRAVTKQGTSNSHCAAATECAAGYTCVGDSDPGNAAWCSRFCADDGDCLGVGSRCLQDLTSSTGAALGISVCTNACEPLAQTGCPSGMGCVVGHATGGAFTDCAYLDNRPDGSTCSSTEQCSEGSICVNTNSGARCHTLCDLANDTCAIGACIGFVTPLVIGGVEYGACN